MKFKTKIFFYSLLLPTLVLSVLSCKTKKATTQITEPVIKIKGGLTDADQAKFTFHFIEGCKERMKGNIENAEGLFKECLKIDPTSTAVKYELGNVYRFNGLYDNALKYGKECANEDPKNEWYQLLYIECLHNKRQFAEAANIYSRLIKNYPNRSEFYEGLAAEFMYSGSYEKSFKTYDEIEKKFGQNEAFTLNKIKLLRQLKKNNEVEAEFKKLIKLNGSEARYFTYLAEFYQETNQNEKAMATYQEILKVDPKNPMVHLAFADYYKSQNDKDNFYKEIKIAFENPDLDVDTKIKILVSYYELSDVNAEYKQQALELLIITLQLHPSSADVHSIYGDFLFKDKKLKEAKEEYVIATQIDKSRFNLWQQLLYVDAELNDFSALEVHSAESMELFPNNPRPYYFNGLANIQLKKYDLAVRSLEDGIEFVYNDKPLLIEYYSSLGNAYNYLKDYIKSDKAFDDALKVDPDNDFILNNYAYFLSLRKEKLEKAEKFSRRCNELKPNNRSYIDTYGWILYQQGKYKEAEEWLSKAVKLGQKSSIVEHYGDVLYKLDRTEEALKYWKEAKQAGGGSELLDKKISEKKLND
ncbi:MAG: tetratricopeptide repeat protein [Burkholderiales bacterium]|nr:tetratricopeptide repeat protein [Bacteroidia bacterium]